MSEPALAPPLPERFGRYVLLECIGQGGMAEVFRAVARGTQGFQRILVVKRILPELSKDPRFVQMFIDEAKICAMISHPNVVQVYEFGRMDDAHFMTMEYVHGRNLSLVMEKLASAARLPPPDVVCEVIRQACLGLHHAHTMTNAEGKPMEIIHRDVTPANLIVGFNGAVKVLDFGIARAAEELKETKTQAGAVKGKVAYLAPEQIHRRPIDHRIDIYSLGVVLHECLTGQRLFKAENPLAAMKAILDNPVAAPSTINSAVPKRVDQIVARAMSRDANMRYANAKAMALDLESALHDMRYFSQRLPTFLKDLFKDEITETKDRILAKELSAIEATLADRAGASPLVRVGSNGESSLNTDVLINQGANPFQRAWQWVMRHNSRKIAAGLMTGSFIATVLFLASRSSAPTLPAPAPTREAPAPPPSKPALVRLSLDSSPQGATIKSSTGEALGTTPTTLERPASSDTLTFTLSLTGFESAALKVKPDIDKPLFARLKAIPDATVAHPTPERKPAIKRRKREAVPLDPFAE